MPDSTLVVVNYNGRGLLQTVLASVLRQTHEGFQVKVVDDASTDDSVPYLRRTWPHVEVVALEENVGITAAFNKAVEAADTEFVALLNNDVELDPRWLSLLVRELREHPGAAGACGKLLQFGDRRRIDAAGDGLARGSATFNRGGGESDQGQWDTPDAVFSVSAAAALYRREAFDVVGPFDEDFVAYLEDTDWAFRAQLAGYSFRYVPSAIGYHMGSATTTQSRSFLALQRQNQIALVAKNYPAGKLIRYAPRIALFHLLWTAASVRDGVLGTHLKGLWMGLRLLPRHLGKRRAIQRARRVDPDRLEQLLDRRWVVRARR